MTNENNEEIRDSQTNALDGLNDKDRKETEEILAELDEKEKGDKKPDDSQEKKPDENKSDELPKKDDKKKSDEDKKSEDDENKRRDPKLIPAWQAKIAEKDAKQREAQLQKEIDELKSGKKPDEKVDAEDELVALAEKFDTEPEQMAELVKFFEKKFGGISPEIQEKLAAIDQINAEKAQEYENMMYTKDFEKQILPLIKQEYGDDVPQEVIDKVNASLKDLAYNDDYLKVPYETLYKGFDQFRNIVPPKKKSAEGSRGGSTFVAGEGSKDYENVTEADIKAMSDEEFQAYSDAMSKKK